MNCNKRQLAFDVRDIRFLKYVHTGLKISGVFTSKRPLFRIVFVSMAIIWMQTRPP